MIAATDWIVVWCLAFSVACFVWIIAYECGRRRRP